MEERVLINVYKVKKQKMDNKIDRSFDYYSIYDAECSYAADADEIAVITPEATIRADIDSWEKIIKFTSSLIRQTEFLRKEKKTG